MSSNSKLQGFVKHRVGASKPASNEGLYGQTDEAQREFEDVDLREANRKKKRHEAQSLKVTKSNIIALAKESSAAAPHNPIDQHKPAQGRDQSIATRSVFGTDSQGADETTILSLDQVPTIRADPSRQVQELSDDAEEDYQSEGHASVPEHADVQEIDMEFESQRLLANVGPRVFGSDRSSFVDTLGNGTSYPPTTTGDFDDDDTATHGILQGDDAAVNERGHGHPFQIRPMSQQLQQVNHDQSHIRRLQPFASNTEDSATSGRVNGSASVQNRFVKRRANDRTIPQMPVPQTRSVLQPQQQQAQTVVQPRRSQHQPSKSAHNRSQTHAAHSTHVNTARDHDDDLRSDDSGESDQASLDHSMEDLIKMPYDKLRNEDQDYNPQARPLVLPEPISAGDLTTKLHHVKDLQADQQATFFAELNIHDWEEAGDWILEQFGSVLKGFREVRTEKRKLAAEVEDRIHGRHERIENRKRKVDEALSEMKASGVAVLDKTPRKKKK